MVWRCSERQQYYCNHRQHASIPHTPHLLENAASKSPGYKPPTAIALQLVHLTLNRLSASLCPAFPSGWYWCCCCCCCGAPACLHQPAPTWLAAYTNWLKLRCTCPVRLGSNAPKVRAAVCRNRQERMYSSSERLLGKGQQQSAGYVRLCHVI
jgi:hypothetical protein